MLYFYLKIINFKFIIKQKIFLSGIEKINVKIFMIFTSAENFNNSFFLVACNCMFVRDAGVVGSRAFVQCASLLVSESVATLHVHCCGCHVRENNLPGVFFRVAGKKVSVRVDLVKRNW